MFGITGGVGLTRGGVDLVMLEFDPEEGGLESVQAEIGTHLLVVVFRLHAVDAEDTGFFSEGGVLGGKEACVAQGSEVFGGEEAVAAKVSDAAGGFAILGGTKSLGGVFDDVKVMLRGKGHDGVHVGHLAEEVDWDDGFGFSPDEGGGVDGIEIEAVFSDIAKDWSGPDAGDAAGGGEEGEGGNNDFIAGADAQGHEREEDGIGAGGDPQVVQDTREGGAFLLKGSNVRAHDKLAAFENTLESGFQFRGERVVLGVDLEKRDGHGVELLVISYWLSVGARRRWSGWGGAAGGRLCGGRGP